MSSKIPHTEENCRLLAEQVTEMWDTQTLVEFVVDVLTERYMKDQELFEIDAKAELEDAGELD